MLVYSVCMLALAIVACHRCVSCIFWFSTTEMNPTGYFIHRSKKISVLCNQSTRCISKKFIVMIMINNMVFVDECGILVLEALCFSNSNSNSNAPTTKEINCRYDNLHQQDDPIDVSFYSIHFRTFLCSLIFLFSMSFFHMLFAFVRHILNFSSLQYLQQRSSLHFVHEIDIYPLKWHFRFDRARIFIHFHAFCLMFES